jgi:hypothetical protein
MGQRKWYNFDLLRPIKQADNTLIESFNVSHRNKCLNNNWYYLIDHIKKKTILGGETIKGFFNTNRLVI